METPAKKRAGVTALFLLTLFFVGSANAVWEEPPKVSTGPIGSPFYRHLAQETGISIKDLGKFEKRGFGRTEVCTLIVISSHTGVGIKEYGKRRLKDKVSLRQLASEAKLDFEDVHRRAYDLKERVEAMGDQNLPPPVFEEPSPTPTPAPKERQKEKKEKKEKPAATPPPSGNSNPNETEMD